MKRLGLVFRNSCRIICDTMFRAEVEPMSPNADVIPRMGLYKVVIYEGERFVRTDIENEIISVAERRAEELNYQFTGAQHTKSARD